MLNGKTLVQARKECFKVMHSGNTKSSYQDIGWQGPHQVMAAMQDAGFEFTLTEARYFNEDKAKEWKLKVRFIDRNGKEKFLDANIVAYCAGTVKDPWNRYDITTSVY